ncbi:MAG: NAD(P)H-dependent oxidoreductase [Deltaproteobacteria bacterium]|nr:NAD(P)H-dependent oxidoreductase [Deltaproteobacteria bacterium]
MALEILIFCGQANNNGHETKVMNFVKDSIRKRGHEPVFINPLKYRLPTDVKSYTEDDSGKAPESLSRLAQKISMADAFVVISGEHNYGIPQPLTDLMEHFLEEYFFRPSGIISYSADKFGGERAAIELRSFLSEIGTVSIPTLVRIPSVQNSFNSSGEPVNPDYQQFINHFLDDLEWYSFALREGRKTRSLPY